MIVSIAFFLLFVGVVICHFHDWRDARNGHINHSRGLKIKSAVSFLSVCLFYYHIHTGPFLPIWDQKWQVLWELVKSSWMTGAYFMLLFNSIWGLRVKKDIFYRSTATGKNKSWSDEIMDEWPRRVYIAFLLGNPILTTYLYFYV